MLSINLLHTFNKQIPNRTVYLFKVETTSEKTLEDIKTKLLNVAGLKSTTNVKSELYSVNSDSFNYQLEVYNE